MDEKKSKKDTTKKPTTAKKTAAKKTTTKAKKVTAKKIEPKKVETKKVETKKAEIKKPEVKIEDKKFEKKPTSKKKSGGFLKGLLTVIIVVILVATCGYLALIQNAKSQVTSQVTSAFDSLKNGDATARDQYLNYDNVIKSDTSADFNVLFSKLDYKIEEVSISKDLKCATVKMTVSNKNIGTIFANYISKMLQLSLTSVFTGASESTVNSQSSEYLASQMESDSIETVSNTLTLCLNKDGENWIINNDKSDIVKAVLPGLTEKIDSMKSTINSVQ